MKERFTPGLLQRKRTRRFNLEVSYTRFFSERQVFFACRSFRAISGARRQVAPLSLSPSFALVVSHTRPLPAPSPAPSLFFASCSPCLTPALRLQRPVFSCRPFPAASSRPAHLPSATSALRPASPSARKNRNFPPPLDSGVHDIKNTETLRAGCKSPPAVTPAHGGSPRASFQGKRRRPGVIPGPTVTVRMKENGIFASVF